MIKFFRKIRQNLVSQNKVGKYILYAAGEIILVVLGIFHVFYRCAHHYEICIHSFWGWGHSLLVEHLPYMQIDVSSSLTVKTI